MKAKHEEGKKRGGGWAQGKGKIDPTTMKYNETRNVPGKRVNKKGDKMRTGQHTVQPPLCFFFSLSLQPCDEWLTEMEIKLFEFSQGKNQPAKKGVIKRHYYRA